MADTREARRSCPDEHHDPLTGLPGRRALVEALGRVLARAERRGTSAAVLAVDVDGFQGATDALGPAGGDELLCAVARRLAGSARPGDLVGRVGGDEFVVVLEDLAHPVEAARLAARLLAELSRPYPVDGRDVASSACIGVAVASRAADPHTLLRDADTAVSRAKAGGRRRTAVFDAALEEQLAARLEMEAELLGAPLRRELTLQYQPIVHLGTGRVTGFEALLRWKHPRRGLLLPPAFLDVAEETGVLLAAGRSILETACRDASTWSGRVGPLPVTVNVSPRQLRDPGFAEVVLGTLEETGLSPRRLLLDVSESSTLGVSAVNAVSTLVYLRGAGVRIHLDDVGREPAWLARLPDLPVDAIKVDGSLVHGFGLRSAPAAVATALVVLARALGLRTLAEGVEADRHLAVAQEIGFDMAQGHRLGRPVPVEEITAS